MQKIKIIGSMGGTAMPSGLGYAPVADRELLYLDASDAIVVDEMHYLTREDSSAGSYVQEAIAPVPKTISFTDLVMPPPPPPSPIYPPIYLTLEPQTAPPLTAVQPQTPSNMPINADCNDADCLTSMLLKSTGVESGSGQAAPTEEPLLTMQPTQVKAATATAAKESGGFPVWMLAIAGYAAIKLFSGSGKSGSLSGIPNRKSAKKRASSAGIKTFKV